MKRKDFRKANNQYQISTAFLSLGNQTWFCNPSGDFETDTPIRTNCIEDWINEIKEEV